MSWRRSRSQLAAARLQPQAHLADDVDQLPRQGDRRSNSNCCSFPVPHSFECVPLAAAVQFTALAVLNPVFSTVLSSLAGYWNDVSAGHANALDGAEGAE